MSLEYEPSSEPLHIWGSLVDDNGHGSPRAGDLSPHVQLFWFQTCDEFRLVGRQGSVNKEWDLGFGFWVLGVRV